MINPSKIENGYRDYSESDVEKLQKIAVYRKLGLSISEIKSLDSGHSIGSLAIEKEMKLRKQNKKNELLNKLASGVKIEEIEDEIAILEITDSIYDKLERAFPGYLGQVFFSAYKPFLEESLNEENTKYFEEYISFMDSLPTLDLSEQEIEYIEKVSSEITVYMLDEVNRNKVEAINNVESWLSDKQSKIEEYEAYKASDEYKNSYLKSIDDKLKRYMQDNNYYTVAVDLLRKISPSYNEYYKNLLIADEKYLDLKNNAKI
ncbi:MerR family transcriptional regulator [Peptoniphilus indolicus]|uniref:HTH merR-type domain-containing protein n=2 Tax=Peptoniphilus indolicus TaxID=33030 RepID=G4D2W9_9FIRM|nr:MerR family transcriptional regulator [Peptoniphilus indolicus]EGY80135.1 hypothetical protein HMPREF9129_0749 [Peptoniphilus indolicus ATCC 29427]SUB75166.1 Transcriptional regulator, effector-binding domain/component [Peptoniphilus indolicus]